MTGVNEIWSLTQKLLAVAPTHPQRPPWALIPLLHYASLCLDSTPTQKHVACHTDQAFIVLFWGFFCFF